MAANGNENGNGNGVWTRWVIGILVLVVAGAVSFVGAEIHSANSTIDDVNRTLVVVSAQVGGLVSQISDVKTALRDAQGKLADVAMLNYKLADLSTKMDTVQAGLSDQHDKLERMQAQAARADYQQGVRLDHIDASVDTVHANQVLAPVTHRRER